MPRPRPLPRSLVPLPGESLAGFLLRLSCRLNQPPARIAEVTGIASEGANGARLPASLLAGIPEPARSDFGHATRLTGEQVTGLGLTAWEERYPLPAWTPGKLPSLPTDRWSLLAPATRYCPECLAGDGSAIQESFGGPWLKAWHLPVVFACPAHRRLLEHRCPECGQSVRGGKSTALLPRMRLAGLHPAQCRASSALRENSACGARIGQARPRQHASTELLGLQGKILGLLDPDGPAATVSAGAPAPSASYFADLRAVSLLACSTWPALRDMSPSAEIAAAIDQHVMPFRQQEAERRASSSRTAVRGPLPPLDAAASAGLTCIADRILAGTTSDVRGHLRSVLPSTTKEAGRTNWARWVAVSPVPCSDGFQAAYDPLLRKRTTPFRQLRPGGARPGTALAAARWGPENVPALVPEDWYERHFTPVTDVSRILARRTASLRLVQMVAGGSLGEAARFLGITTSARPRPREGHIYSSAGLVHSGARHQPEPSGFEDGLRNLARELNAPGTLLGNYQQRRQALENWSIDERTWDRLLSGLPPLARSHTPDLGDSKRQLASVYVWVRVTCGEPAYAPRTIEKAQHPEVQASWRRTWNATWWSLLTINNPGSAYTRLRAELDALADALAGTLDPSHSSARQLGAVPRYVSRRPRRPKKRPGWYFDDAGYPAESGI